MGKVKRKSYSLWKPPTYLLKITGWAEIPYVVSWQGSLGATDIRAVAVSKIIWFFIVNPFVAQAFESLQQVLPDGGAEQLRAFIAENPVPQPLTDLRCLVADEGGRILGSGKAGDPESANIRLSDLGAIARFAS